MKMFPHSFVPILGFHWKNPASVPPVDAKPRGLDVEVAADLLMTAHKASGSEMRQKYRIDVINGVPEDAIDWETVDWVQAVPFKTRRR